MTPIPLEAWRDFYVLIGTAAGAIVGATFVVATLIGERSRTVQERERGLHGFITPSAVHLGVVLVASAALAMPVLNGKNLGVLLVIGGLAGMCYALVVIWRILHMDLTKLDLSDRCFYMALPLAAYAAIAAAGILAWRDAGQCLLCVGLALIALLVIGMRNAWDMASFMIMRDPKDPPPEIRV